ncbi:MAG TPA: glycosyltransferase [Casimicrobiaceae bacterium]|nr:glycosyltransferase [Casimicrobiaceae bacterium]
MRRRLTLVSHIDWGHIRQRPHHLATALASTFDVSVLAPVSRKRNQLVGNRSVGVRCRPIFRLPGSYRSAIVVSANGFLASLQARASIRDADVVIVTSPELLPWVEPALGSRLLVYDCMDDALAFAQDPRVRTLKERCEARLLARADLVVCSSEELVARLRHRGARAERLAHIGNGWDPVAFPIEPSRDLPRTGPLELVYFGTLGSWIDAEALRALVATVPDVFVRLIGPRDHPRLHAGERLTIEPPVTHDRLADATRTAHGFLLPFIVDDLTRAVEPVKLYEYMATGKPILGARWPAIERFGDYVTFYDGAQDLAERVRSRSVVMPPSAALREAFLREQSWSARAAALIDAIQRLTQ